MTVMETQNSSPSHVNRPGPSHTERSSGIRHREQVLIHGRAMAYRQSGIGPAIVLIHGIAEDSDTWIRIIRTLARDHRVVAPDLFGSGESDNSSGDYSLGDQAASIRDLMDRLGIESATLVGHSLGGGIALQFAYLFPERCDRLVLVASGGLGREVHPLLRLLTVPGVNVVLPLACSQYVSDRGRAVLKGLRQVGVQSNQADTIWKAHSNLVERSKQKAFIRSLNAVIDPGGQSIDATDRLYLTQGLPVLIVWGDADNVIPVDHAIAAQKAIPHSRLHVIPGVGHFPHIEARKEFLEVIGQFLSET
jgi:pimeloyl-ACP methyl ester carboxylesterase